LPYDNRNDNIGADSGTYFHGTGLGYYGADGDTFLWGNDDRGSNNVSRAGSVLLDKRSKNPKAKLGIVLRFNTPTISEPLSHQEYQSLRTHFAHRRDLRRPPSAKLFS
jgi:hypothetical protein